MEIGQVHRQRGRRMPTAIERLIPCEPGAFATKAIPCGIVFLWYTMVQNALLPLVGDETAGATFLRYVAHALVIIILANFGQALRIDPGVVPKEWAKWDGRIESRPPIPVSSKMNDHWLNDLRKPATLRTIKHDNLEQSNSILQQLGQGSIIFVADAKDADNNPSFANIKWEPLDIEGQTDRAPRPAAKKAPITTSSSSDTCSSSHGGKGKDACCSPEAAHNHAMSSATPSPIWPAAAPAKPSTTVTATATSASHMRAPMVMPASGMMMMDAADASDMKFTSINFSDVAPPSSSSSIPTPVRVAGAVAAAPIIATGGIAMAGGAMMRSAMAGANGGTAINGGQPVDASSVILPRAMSAMMGDLVGPDGKPMNQALMMAAMAKFRMHNHPNMPSSATAAAGTGSAISSSSSAAAPTRGVGITMASAATANTTTSFTPISSVATTFSGSLSSASAIAPAPRQTTVTTTSLSSHPRTMATPSLDLSSLPYGMRVNPMEIQWPHQMPGHPDYQEPVTNAGPRGQEPTMRDFGFNLKLTPHPPANVGSSTSGATHGHDEIKATPMSTMRPRTAHMPYTPEKTALLAANDNESEVEEDEEEDTTARAAMEHTVANSSTLENLAGDPYPVNYCDICKHYKPPRSHHCSSCGRCVLRMDHHCIWLNKCIGLYNNKYFILFLTYCFISLCYVIMVATSRILRIGAPRGVWSLVYFWIPYFGCFYVAKEVAQLAHYHWKRVMTNVTQIEYMFQPPKTHSKYSTGSWVTNLSLVFGPNILFWLLPFGPLPSFTASPISSAASSQPHHMV